MNYNRTIIENAEKFPSQCLKETLEFEERERERLIGKSFQKVGPIVVFAQKLMDAFDRNSGGCDWT
jgi:hypothetical protein